MLQKTFLWFYVLYIKKLFESTVKVIFHDKFREVIITIKYVKMKL